MKSQLDYFRQHHTVDAPRIDEREFRPFFRVRTRLDQLFLDNAISHGVWRSALAYRCYAELALAAGWRTQRFIVEPTGSPYDLSLARRFDAIAAREQVRRELGLWVCGLLDAHIVEDRSWGTLGRRYGVHPRTVRVWVIIALQGLHGVLWAS